MTTEDKPERKWTRSSPEDGKARLEAGVSHELNTGCWLWAGRCDHKGYGLMAYRGERRAHRSSWVLHHGPIPEGMYVCHTCDVPACVNPAHLFLGSASDNNKDRNAKGRTAQGSNVGGAKLSVEDTLKIRVERARGKGSAALAREFGVNTSHIRRICNGVNWEGAALSDLKKLRARVATLERECTELRTGVQLTWQAKVDAEKARAEAAEQRVRDAADRLTGILKGSDRKDPLELETCVDEAERRVAELERKGRALHDAAILALNFMEYGGRRDALLDALSANYFPPVADGATCTGCGGKGRDVDTDEEGGTQNETHFACSTCKGSGTSSQPSTHSAPAGLLEAVREARSHVQRIYAHRAADEIAKAPEDSQTGHYRAALRLLDGVLAAYDAAKGGEDEWTVEGHNEKGAKDRERACIAALNEAGVPREVPIHAGILSTFPVHRVRWLAEKARKWDAAVERAKDVDAMTNASANFPSELRDDDRENIGRYVTRCSRYVLGLDTPPSGPGGGEPSPPESPESSDPRAATLEDFRNGTTQRARIPEPTPGGPALASHVEPVTLGKGPFAMLPDVAAGAVERTHRTVTEAQSEAAFVEPNHEPAAPEVVLDRDGVRVEKWPEAGDYTIHFSAGGSAKALDVLARALAEATQENHLLKAEISEHLRAWMSARKAAESMRERAKALALSHKAGFLAEAIRALPLEDK